MIERTEIMTTADMINWLGTLSRGYAKPDLSTTSANATGTVNETKNYMSFIMSINSELCKRAGIECPDISSYLEPQTKRR